MGTIEVKEDVIERLLEHRKAELMFYSPYSFNLRGAGDKIYEITIRKYFLQAIGNGDLSVYQNEVDGRPYVFIYQHLAWDSDYFGLKTYKLEAILHDGADVTRLAQSVDDFVQHLTSLEAEYLFTVIPSEDILSLQSMGLNAFRLIETRMTYAVDLLGFEYPRFRVRKAGRHDVENLKRVAREMRNPFDRFHADPIFSKQLADEFLATYIEASVNGFADITIIPDEEGVPSDAFLTANYLRSEWDDLGFKASKMVLSAVAQTCKGWYIKLIAEMAHHLREEGAEVAFMHPASTNRAVIRS